MPLLTEDRRKELTKKSKTYGEETKIAIRNIRRDYIEKIKKDDSYTEDTSKKESDEIQKLTDDYCKKVDEEIKIKNEEIMKI